MNKTILLIITTLLAVKLAGQGNTAILDIHVSKDIEKKVRFFSRTEGVSKEISPGGSESIIFKLDSTAIKPIFFAGNSFGLKLAPNDKVKLELSSTTPAFRVTGGRFLELNEFNLFKGANMPMSWSKDQSLTPAADFETAMNNFQKELKSKLNVLVSKGLFSEKEATDEILRAKYFVYRRKVSYPFMNAAYSYKKKPDSIPQFTKAILSKEVLNNPEVTKYGKDFLGMLIYNMGKYYASNHADKDNPNSLALLDFANDKITNPLVKSEFAQSILAIQLREYSDAGIKPVMEYFTANCLDEKVKKEMLAKVEEISVLGPGKPAPEIELITMDGKKRYLSEFKGKNVYIDVWATYCGKCLAEMPNFRKLESDYKDKNWVFLSVSIDTDVEKWKKKASDLGHLDFQFVVEKGHKSKFNKDYRIGFAPRYIIIDAQGKFVNFNAPFPSDKKTRRIMDKVK